MAKTTATVTVGADTSPFERKMRTLGKGIGGGLTTGIGKVGGMAMSGLGAGVGAALGFLGIQGLSSFFDMMLAQSPALNEQFIKLKTAMGQALLPAAEKLATVLTENMPAIQEALEGFGNMLADAIGFWTEDAWDPAVWADIGEAIADSFMETLTRIKEGVPELAKAGAESLGLPEEVALPFEYATRYASGEGTMGQLAGFLGRMYAQSEIEGARSL